MKKKPVVIFLLAIVTLGAIWFAGGNVLPMNVKQAGQKALKQYHCPMHPTVVSEKPGDCPVCSMRLVPTEVKQTLSAQNRPEDANAICIMHNCSMIKNGQKCPMMVLAEKGEKITCPVCKEAVDAQPKNVSKIIFYRHPMRPEVKSPVPSKDEMGMDYIPVYSDELDVKKSLDGAQALPTGYASVLITPERQQLIGIRTGIVKKNEALKKIRAAGRIASDPDLYQSQSEYLESYKSFNNAQKSGDKNTMDWASKLMDSAKIKLTRMGLNSEMIEALQAKAAPDKSLLYAIPDGDAWVYANIYEYEIPYVKVGDELSVETPSSTSDILRGNIRAIDTVVEPTTRTVRIRALVRNNGGLLKPDMFVNVSLEANLGKLLMVPEEAVFFTGKTNIVFVDKGDGLFEPRRLSLGPKAGDFYVVNDGLSEGEKVVTNGNFLVDSESKLKSALNSIGAS